MTDVDEFLAPPEPHKEFDRWGRYLLPHPRTGKMQAWTRTTTFAKALSDEFALSLWSQRMTAKGLSLRPDLVSLASTLDVKKDKDRMDSLVEQAKDTAGQKNKANLGTAYHTFTEKVDSGETLESVPLAHREDICAYVDKIHDLGLTPVPHLIERRTAITSLGVAGTFDRIFRDSDGEYVIGDLKTGNIQYEMLKIQIQLALYAHGVNESGVWDPDRRQWQDAPRVRTDYGVVLHLVPGSVQCTAYRVDLNAGWEDAQLCSQVRKRRSRRITMDVYEVPGLDWEQRFASVTTRQEASALFKEAARTLPKEELDRLSAIGLKALDTSSAV